MKISLDSIFLRIFLITIFVISPILLSAQKIEGYVFSNISKLPLEEVAVFLSETSNGTVTDSKGFFILTLDKKLKPNDSLVFQYLGFIKKSFPLRIF
ncbi:carboxypeptidase-like regulatory domain-containing protein [Maribacter sp. ACAM166]|uniref:carboxypeptidase-like regulatory domain-containing protein n=1 Tax=Maribacter sp. ACAM166 TaxID=2508996 RepID=UPI0010FEFA97|nr:carboxypeptidase-like regulatory domain-containing protein [Maribacter sp. ACAM166]